MSEQKAVPEITVERAAEAVQRLINSHFRNPKPARCSIPASLDDDDIVASRYVQQSSKAIAALTAENARLREALEHLLEHTEMRGNACKLLAVGKARAAIATPAPPVAPQ